MTVVDLPLPPTATPPITLTGWPPIRHGQEPSPGEPIKTADSRNDDVPPNASPAPRWPRIFPGL